MTLMIGQAVLEEAPGPWSMAGQLWRDFRRGDFRNRVGGLARILRQEADATVLRGLLALEQGDVDEAEVAFRLALGLWKDPAAAASGAGLDFNGRPVAQGCLEWLK
jgi:hypothetical protein